MNSKYIANTANGKVYKIIFRPFEFNNTVAIR